MALRNPFKKTPSQWDSWTPVRQQQFIKNRQSFNKLVRNYNQAERRQNTVALEKLRGKANAVRLGEKQQRETFRDKVELSRLEQRQMGLQQQFVSQIGEISATQLQQFKQMQDFLVSQTANQQQQLQQQATFFQQLQEEQQRLAQIEADRAAQQESLAQRDLGLAQYAASEVGLFNLQSETRNLARQRASQRSRNIGIRNAVFRV